jgi:hypothetical protein
LKRTKAITMILIAALTVTIGAGMFAYLSPVQSVVPGPGEPQSLQDIVEYPDPMGLIDLEGAERDAELGPIMVGVEGFSDISDVLQGKGYVFDNASAKISFVLGVVPGRFLSWWSDMGPNGTRALIIAALMDDGTDMVVGAITNLLPPELVPEVDPYIIVNAMPYLFIRWYWWVWAPVARIHTWHYWWYDSHSHPNWFWGVYWWWRTDVEYYWLRGAPYVAWWWMYWHWTYWRHWYWWSTYFPY